MSNPSHGTISAFNSATGEFTYTPDTNFNGSDSFTYRVSDGSLTSNLATVKIQVNAVNDAPTAEDQVPSLPANSASGTVVADIQASDVDRDQLTYAFVSGNAGAPSRSMRPPARSPSPTAVFWTSRRSLNTSSRRASRTRPGYPHRPP